jgi:hypothetical protein
MPERKHAHRLSKSPSLQSEDYQTCVIPNLGRNKTEERGSGKSGCSIPQVLDSEPRCKRCAGSGQAEFSIQEMIDDYAEYGPK